MENQRGFGLSRRRWPSQSAYLHTAGRRPICRGARGRRAHAWAGKRGQPRTTERPAAGPPPASKPPKRGGGVECRASGTPRWRKEATFCPPRAVRAGLARRTTGVISKNIRGTTIHGNIRWPGLPTAGRRAHAWTAWRARPTANNRVLWASVSGAGPSCWPATAERVELGELEKEPAFIGNPRRLPPLWPAGAPLPALRCRCTAVCLLQTLALQRWRPLS